MARYNHFSQHKYKQIKFVDLSIGDLFRKDFFKNGRRRIDVICKKTGDLTWIEVKSQITGSYKFVNADVIVSSFNEVITKR